MCSSSIWAPWETIKERHNQKKEDKGKSQNTGKAPKYAHSLIAHCNIGTNEVLFNTSFAPRRHTSMLDTVQPPT